MGTIYTRETAEETAREFIDDFDLQLWPRPVPVSERLPKDSIRVLAYERDDDTWHIGYRSRGEWYEHNTDLEPLVDVTHWLPLPPKPE